MARKNLTRRFFIGTAAAGLAGAAVSIKNSEALAGTPGDNPVIFQSNTGMKYRKLGRTNLMISEMILGCASGLRSNQLGPVLFNRYREQLGNIVSQLFERGGNAVATSSSYHDTEELLGKALVGRRKNAIIVTSSPPLKDVKSVMDSCERSLVRFQTDYIDCYFCHGGWSEPFYEAAKKLQEQGKIRFIGQSAHKPDMHVQRIEANQIDFFMQPYNYMSLAKWTEKLDGKSAEDLFVLAKKKNIGVLTIKPFSGHFIPNWAKNTTDKMVQNMLSDLDRFGKKNLYQAMLLWVLQNQNISAAVCGFNEPQDVVDDFEGYLGGKLSSFQVDLLKRYYTLATNDYCRLCETCVPVCPKGIPIPDIQRFRMYYKNYGHKIDAKEYYAKIDPSRCGSACDGCGKCEAACPSGVAIVNSLKDAHELLA